MGILEALLNAEYPKTEIILNHKDYIRMTKKEITATVKGTDMFEFNGKLVNVAQLIKTSEDLTDENLNLISELDKYNQLINLLPKSTIGPIRFFKADENQQTELEYIKSTRLYKFFKWLGVW